MREAVFLISSILLFSGSAAARASSPETLMWVPPPQIVDSMLFAPDGKVIATIRYEGEIHGQAKKPPVLQLWAVPKATLLWTAEKPVARLLAFSPDSTVLVAVANDGNVIFYDARTGRVRRSVPGMKLLRQNAFIRTAVFLPDGQTLVVALNKWGTQIPMTAASGEIQLWNAKTGRLIRALKSQTNAVAALAISPDGKTLATANGRHGLVNSVSVLDLPTDSLRHTLQFESNIWIISSLAFSPDGKILATGSGTTAGSGEIRLWDVATGQLQKTLTDFSPTSTPRISKEPYLSFSPDGKTLASVGEDQTMILWDPATGQMQKSLQSEVPPRHGRYTIQFKGDGLFIGKVNSSQHVEVQFWNYTEQ